MAGDGNARIPELIICRLGEVSPVAGRLYLWFCARRNHKTGGWRCPLPEAAAALKMELSTAYSARRELLGFGIRGKTRGLKVREPWIDVGDDDFTRPLVGYDSANAENECANADSDSANAHSQAANAHSDCANAENECANAQSPISKDRARGLTSPLPLTLPSPLPPQTHTHTDAQNRAPNDPPAAGVGVCSAFTFEERKRYAANNRDRSGELLGPGWLKESRDGSSDELIADWYAKQARKTAPAAQAQRDTSNCPDCTGSGWWYPQGKSKGMAKCSHPRLIDAGDTSPPATALVAARSP